MPNLFENSYIVEREFCRQLSTHTLPESISIIQPRVMYDLKSVKAALLLCSLTSVDIEWATLSTLLHSRYIAGYEQEKSTRALLDAKVRELSRPKMHWRSVLALAKDSEKPHYSPLLNNMIEMVIANKYEDKVMSASQWMRHFNNRLAAFGWVEKNTDLQDDWEQCLADIMHLDTIYGDISHTQAVQLLSQQTTKHTQKESFNIKANVQVISAFDAVGSQFDAIWLFGMTDTTWPKQSTMNTLLPAWLQREHSMPNANPKRELAFSQRMLCRLHETAKQTIASYAKANKNGPCHLNPLIKNWHPLHININNFNFNFHTIESDNISLPVKSNEIVCGGTGIIKQQALCPFSAFAQYRLNAYGLTTPKAGISPAERGTLLHHALEALWLSLKDQTTLLSLNKHELNNSIQLATNKAFVHLLKNKPHLEPKFSKLEKKRLEIVLTQWIETEKSRPSFSVIACEKKASINLDQLKLTFRIDRIDQLDNGDHLLIDYKTHKTSANTWFDEQLTEPQLPLYYLATDNQSNAIAYAQVTRMQSCYKGISQTDTDIQGIESLDDDIAWSELINQWQDSALQLAKDFISGKADVAPIEHKSACQYCNLHSLCRINEQEIQ